MPDDRRFDSGLPIYLQLMQQIRQRIVRGEWPPGTRVPGVRELAVECGVNPNTMQRALAELEREGILFSERTAGRFVTRSTEEIERTRDRMARELTSAFLEQMGTMGYSREQIAALLLSWKDAGSPPESE
ncbi:MAG: GntR family transcriptional regulator [Clostridiales bacterium]|nr:GntR family transcriptional regulator [Clostridiales bacterium]